MNKAYPVRWIHIVIFCLMAILLAASGSVAARAGGASPAEMLERAWRNAQQAGNYRFLSDIDQTVIPRPVPWMIGQQETAVNLTLDGAVVLPDQGYTELRVLSSQRSESVVMLRDGGQSFMLQDGELKPVENALSLASQSNDVLGYLAAADQVTLLDPPAGHPELVRYGFLINGPRYAEYVRQQAEAVLLAEPGAPQGLTVKPLPTLEQLTGQGELWVNQAGFPVRQVVDLEMPQVTDEYGARIRMSVDLSGFGEIEALPQAVQGPDGSWHLEGPLPDEAASSLGMFPGFGAKSDQIPTGQPTHLTTVAGWWARFVSHQPLRVSPTSVILFVILLLAVLFVRYYRRNPRRCYALVVFVLIPIFVFSPLLQSAGVVRFMERQVQAAEARAAAFPDLLGALGFETQDIRAASIAQKDGTMNAAGPASLRLDNQLAASAALQQNNEEDMLLRCGDGEIGVDTDGDGLTDPVELCLGTNVYLADSDQDGIPDKVEIDGFDLADQHWDSDPLQPDSNEDGILDTLEWSATLTANGQAKSADLDGDGVPNLWDDDDDGDAVPDAQDLSPFAVTDYTTVAALSTEGSGFSGYETIEIQVQPEDPDHLRYSTTALDWPADDEGNIQDRDDWNSREDLRLAPFLIVTTNAAPDSDMAARYGYRSWVDDGQVILMAPLVPLQAGGAVHGFYAKVAYAPEQIADIQWQAQMVWMAEAQIDHHENFTLITEAKTVHQYQDSFRITGLEVTKEAGYEAAVLGTPDQLDDLYLFRILLGLNDTFKSYATLENQESGETALEEIAQRFAPGSQASLTHTFGVAPGYVAISEPAHYDTMDAGLFYVGAELVPGFLQDENNATFYNQARCQDAEQHTVSCASLIVAYEQSMGVRDLADLPVTASGATDLASLHVNLADVPLLTTRGLQMRMYEQGTDGWAAASVGRTLELIEQRYKDGYGTAMRDIYPGLDVDDLRFLTYASYLWALTPSYAAISADGQYLVDEIPDEEALALGRALDPGLEGEAETAVDYWSMGTQLAGLLISGGSSYIGWAFNDLVEFVNKFSKLSSDAKGWNGLGVGLSAITTGAGMIMGVISAICESGSEAAVCRNEDALKIGQAVVDSIAIIGQAYAVADLIIKGVTHTLEALSNLAVGVQVVGFIIGLAVTWISFALTLAFGGLENPVAWRMALAQAIVTTIYLAIILILNCIPIIGQIITAIMGLIDAILALFTGLFTDETYTIATAILGIFYNAVVCTNVQDASFGEFSTSLADSDLGLVGGNTLVISAPFTGSINKEKAGTDDDLSKSSIEGQMTWQYPYFTSDELTAIFPGQDKGTEADCEIVDDVMYCSNTAALGFALSPRINGLVPVAARTNYTIIWAETGMYGAWRWSTKTWKGFAPEDADLLKPEFMVMDVLPVSVTELWNWSALTNHDPDGDGLTSSQETTLGTSSIAWDTDGDGLSDYHEWQHAGDQGGDPLNSDTDGDGLIDSLELRSGTFIDVADSDGDGLKDGEEVRRYQDGTMVGGWQVSLSDAGAFWVSSDPMLADTDGDGLNDAEEKANGLSPQAPNQRVPALSLRVTPLRGVPGGRAGAYWLPNESIEIKIQLSNGSPDAVTSDLTLELPSWLGNIQGGTMEGDRAPALTMDGGRLSWSFSEASALQSYESVSTTITATTTSASGSGEIALSLLFNSLQMRKAFSAVLDGDDPNVAILAPADGAYLRGTHYVVGGSAADPTTWIETQSLSIVPQGADPNFQSLPRAEGAWAYTWELPGDGVYSLQAYAADVMGHAATSNAVSVTVDNTPPTIDLSYAMQADTVHLSGSTNDNLAGVHWVQVSIDGQPWRSLPFSGSSWSYDWTVGEGAQGSHTVHARAIDHAGNESTTASAEIIVDSVAPSSIISAGADRDVPPAVKPDSSFTLSGVADEGGHLPQPATPAGLRTGMDVFDESAIWLGLSSIHENDGGVLAAWIGDFNADRLSDLAVGLPGPQGDAGFVSVLYGRAGGWSVPPDLEMLAESPMRFIGSSGARLGSLLAAAGDANGDNLDDLLIGERASSRAFLVFGNPRKLGEVTLEAGLSAYRVMLQAPDTITGLAAAGDVDGNGYGDLLIHAGGTVYLVLGHAGPWSETIDVAAEYAAAFKGVTRALGVGDVDNDQMAEWVTLANETITLYGWNSSSAEAEPFTTLITADPDPRAVALGDVNADGYADWIYTDGSSRVLVYGPGAASHTFSDYDGFFAAPGDVDGDGRADILLANAAGQASLVGKPSAGSPAEFATIAGVGGAANAPYAAGADLNSDGSADLLLIPSQAAAEAHGFDAPDFSSGFISPQSLPLGASLAALSEAALSEMTLFEKTLLSKDRTMELQEFGSIVLLSASSDTRYVDDDRVCDGHTPCYQTIQEAVTASDGGGDIVIVYPGTYTNFYIPSGTNYDGLTVQGVSADAVFVDGGGTSVAIQVGANQLGPDGVRLSNLTVRNATYGVYLDTGAGEPTLTGGRETSIDHLLAHSVQYPVSMSGTAALDLSDSTLVGNGTNPIINVGQSSGVHSWNSSHNAVPLYAASTKQPIAPDGVLLSTAAKLYARPGGETRRVYVNTPYSTGPARSWESLDLKHMLPYDTGAFTSSPGQNLLAASGTALYQLHTHVNWPKLGGLANEEVHAVALAPNGDVYIGGAFTSIGSLGAYHIARWDGTTWHSVGIGTENGTNGTVRALAFDNFGNLYVGGDFTKAGTKDAGHVAGWNGSAWFVLGSEGTVALEAGTIILNGVNGPVNTLTYDAVSSKLYIGGQFRGAYEYYSSAGGLNGDESPNLTAWSPGCTPSLTSTCFQHFPYLDVNGPVTALALGGSGSARKLYVGGDFSVVGSSPFSVTASNIASYNTMATSGGWTALGAGLPNLNVKDLVVDAQGHLIVATSNSVYEWNGASWSLMGGISSTERPLAVGVDGEGNVYAAAYNIAAKLYVQVGGSGDFQQVGYEPLVGGNAIGWVNDIAIDSAGHIYLASNTYDNGMDHSTWRGGLSRWVIAGIFKLPDSGGSWTRLPYPPTPTFWDLPKAMVGDENGNLYAIWGDLSNGVLYYYNAATNTWTRKADPNPTRFYQHLVWADGKLYALGNLAGVYESPNYVYRWRFDRYDPATNTWTEMASPPIPNYENPTSGSLTEIGTGIGISWTWGGSGHIYLMPGDGTDTLTRYSLSTNTWENGPSPTPHYSFSISHGPAMARVGSYLYVYATPGESETTNLFYYGMIPESDLRLTVNRTAFVVPDSATSFNWLGLTSVAGYYRFQADIDTSNAWVGPSSATWSPTLPTGAARLTSAQADFMAPEDGLYRLGPDSLLTAGYHHYKPAAHVYTSQAACAECASGGLTWGEDAFATIRQAVESGAARILVHPGRYPQTFYLVSGVEVIGAGAESTIIEPPAGTAATLVTAEGVAGASLARLTLAGGGLWDGFLAEGGTQGIRLTRAILRDLNTGVRLRGDSQVEITSSTFVRNTDGLAAEGTNPVSVRNTIFAYNSSTGLSHGENITSLSNTYNDFWLNGTDISPDGVSLGSLFVDPRFRSLAQNDLRLAARSPLIDKGAPTDPTLPGGGERVDIGYAEYNAAGFYVSKSYSETSLNDGLTWGVDAFDQIQPALDAAAQALYGLQGAVPEGGYSVAVDTGIYTERVIVPSHVRLVGSGAEVTTLDAGNAGSAVTFDGVIDSTLSGFTVQNAGAGGAGVEITGASSAIRIERNVIRGSASHGVSLEGSSSAQVLFNTITDNGGAGVSASDNGTWVQVSSSILDGNAFGLQAASGGLIRNDYNLLDNTTNLSGVTAGAGTLEVAPAFTSTGYYIPRADSPAIDAADPLAEVPQAGGLRADLGYKELIASPLTLVLGPEIDSTVTGNSGVVKVEVGVMPVVDATLPVTSTLPTTWQTVTPASTSPALFYWSSSISQATPGFYRVYSRATDAAGNTESGELDWYEGAFVVDGTAPTLNWGSPALPDSTNAAAVLAAVDVTGTVTTGSGTRDDLAQAYFNVTGPAGSTIYPAEDGQAWIPLPATGSYAIQAVAVDEAGNQSSLTKNVVVSASSSVATITSHAANSSANGTAITLRGFVRFTAAGAGTVAVSVSGSATVQAVLDAPGAQFSAWTADITLPEGEGSKTITVTPSQAGTDGAPADLTLTLDTTAPTLSVTTPATGAVVNQTVNFSGTASDAGSSLSRVEISIDGGFTWRPAAIESGSWSLDWDLGLDQDYVSYPVQVQTVDAAGNTAVIERVLVVDNLPPTDLAPADFDQPVGQHLDLGSTLTISWNSPVDGSGGTQVFLAVDRSADTTPITEVSGVSAAASLDEVGDWYVHLMAQDAAGNQALTHYGPWHVRDLTAASFSDRRESIVLDGYLDLAHDEWQASDLLGIDARSGNPQELYLSLDGENIFLGWSGAWWTLDGVLWAYLDAAAGGANFAKDGSALPAGFEADLAVEISGPDAGALWAWNGSQWVESALTFANGSSGDTEVQVPWPGAAGQSLNLVAFALPRQAEEIEVVQTLALDKNEALSLDRVNTLALDGGMEILEAGSNTAPWAVFPTTNGLAGTITQDFAWTADELNDLSQMNQNQPAARTVYLEVTSPQAASAAACQNSGITYDIQLTNPEPDAISGLTLNLVASTGLSYQAVSGATLSTGAVGDAVWTLAVPDLAAGASKHVLVAANTGADLSGLKEVTSTFTLTAGTTPLTAESEATATIAHHVDGQAPVVSIDALGGAAIGAGMHTFTGLAGDLTAAGQAGSGVARVEVSLDGSTWTTALGTTAWSLPLSTPSETGDLTLQARAVDACGLTSEAATRTFIVDVTPPDVAWTMPDAVTRAVFDVSGTTSDPVPLGGLVRSVEVQLDSDTSAWHAAGGPFAPQDGVQGWMWPWLPPVEDGVAHQLRVRATDQTGNTTTSEWQQTVVDVVAPQITVTQPADGTILPTVPFGSPIMSGTAADGSGVQDVTILVYDPQGGAAAQEAVLTGDAWAYTPDMAGWSIGTYLMRVQAVDIHGNLSVTGPYQFTVTDTPVTGLAASNDGPHMVDETVTFTATITTGSNAIYHWTFGDGATADGPVVEHPYAEPGVYTATVTAANPISMQSAETLVTIMALTVEAGPDQQVDEGDTVGVTAAFTDSSADASHSAVIDWGDGTVGDSTVDDNVVVDETAKTITGSRVYADNGTYTVQVEIKNGLDQTSQDTLQVTVNNVAPTADLVIHGSREEGIPVEACLENVQDPGTADIITYSFDWENDGEYDVDGQAAACAVKTWPDNGAHTVKARIADDDGGSNEYTTEIIVINDAPEVNLGGGAEINEGDTFNRTGSFTDLGDDTWEATVDYGDGSGAVPLALNDHDFELNHTYADDGVYEVKVCVTDDDGGVGCDTVVVTVNNIEPTIVSADPISQTVQYSDAIKEITFIATDVAADAMNAELSWSMDGSPFQSEPPFAGLSLVQESCSGDESTSTCTWKVTGNALEPAGSYIIRLTVSDEDGGSTHADVTLNVDPEEADVVFDQANLVAVPVAEPGGSSGLFDLTVCVSEPDDGSPGDIFQAQMGMSLVPVGPGGPVPPLENGVVEYMVDDSKCATFSFDGVPVNTYTVQVTVDGGYYTGAGEDVLVVYDPSLGFTTGGGWFYWPDTANPETGYPGDRTNFGFTMKYNKKGNNVQGNLLLIRHLPDDTFYRVKSNALYGLALGEVPQESYGWATFSGKSTYMEPGWPEPVGNYEFITYVEDRNEPGSGADRFWIEVLGGLALEAPVEAQAIEIMGGNIIVPHGGGKTKVK